MSDKLIRLRVTKADEDHILLEALVDIRHYGFGTFLCDILPAEIECDEFSKQAMLQASEKSGLRGMEIWADNRIAWGSPSESIIMPVSEISKHRDAEKWLKEIVTP